jgi:hypothetical protein
MTTHVPCGGAIVCLCNVVIPLAVATHKKDFVVSIITASLIESINIVLELLPLRKRSITFIIGRICAVDQSKVGGGLFNVSGEA